MKDITLDGDTEPSSDTHIESDTFPRSEPLTSEARTFAINKKILIPSQPDISYPPFSSHFQHTTSTATNKIKPLKITPEQALDGFTSNTPPVDLTTPSTIIHPAFILSDILKARQDSSKQRLCEHQERLAETIRSRARPYDPEDQARRNQRAHALLHRDEKRAKCGTLQSYDSKRYGRQSRWFFCNDILNCKGCNHRYFTDLRRRFEHGRKRRLDRRSKNRNALENLHEHAGNVTAPHQYADPVEQTKRLLAAKTTFLGALRRKLKLKYPALEPFCAWLFMLDWTPGHPHFHWWALLPWSVVRWMNKAWIRALKSAGFDTGALKKIEVPKKCRKFRSPSYEFELLDGLAENKARRARRYVVESPLERKHFDDSDYLAERIDAQIALTPFSRTRLDTPSQGFLAPKRDPNAKRQRALPT